MKGISARSATLSVDFDNNGYQRRTAPSANAFYKFDTRGQGIVTTDEFKLAMEELGQDSVNGRKLNLEPHLLSKKFPGP